MKSFIRIIGVVFSICMFICLSGCSSTQAETHSNEITPDRVDVFLIPLEDFNFQATASLAKSLTQELGIHVKPTVNMGIGNLAPFPGTKQFSAEEIETNALRIIPNLKETVADTAYIVLTTRDINSGDRALRFSFSHYDSRARVAVVSAARLSMGRNGGFAERKTTIDRLTKLVKRSIGVVYYGYTRSTDINDVLYSPLMSVDDLDRMGSDFMNAKR